MSFKSSFRIIGLMSGTSLDGLDLADVQLTRVDSKNWEFTLLGKKHYPYSIEWQEKLSTATACSSIELAILSHELAKLFADCVKDYLANSHIPKELIDAISNHGHTVFHQPKNGITVQIANGPELAVETGITTVGDFRTKDVALGGNGAPLVPIGDQLLFGRKASSFLNLGGFSNLSFKKSNEIIAFDICPVNVVLNRIAKEFGEDYDKSGQLGEQGSVDNSLLERLNQLDYYSCSFPKSLGIEWVNQMIDPLLSYDLNFLRTFYEHIAIQIAIALKHEQLPSVFVTGGGTKNTFLLTRIQSHYNGELIIPPMDIIDYKEAIVFALLGALRLTNEVNVLSSVTGARNDSCSGVIHNPL